MFSIIAVSWTYFKGKKKILQLTIHDWFENAYNLCAMATFQGQRKRDYN